MKCPSSRQICLKQVNTCWAITVALAALLATGCREEAKQSPNPNLPVVSSKLISTASSTPISPTASATGSSAAVYKCKQRDGSVMFSDQPCVDTQSEIVHVAQVSTVDNSKLMAKAEIWKLRDKQDAQYRATRQNQPTRYNDVNADVGTATSSDCASAKRILSSEDGSRLSSAEDVRKAKLAAEAACGQKMTSVKEEEANRRQQRVDARPPAESAPVPLVNCDATGCWGTNGQRYNNSGGGNYINTSNGQVIRPKS